MMTKLLAFAATFAALLSASLALVVRADDSATVAEFRQKIEPLLKTYCYDCHGEGLAKGGMKLDGLSDGEIANELLRWSKTLKNVRAGVMPPADCERPNEAEMKTLAEWIKFRAFKIDPTDLDPGQATIHRLNRIEYRNTIADLLGVDFNAADELPFDAAGAGFDNIAELLSVSPLMLEKYLNAADAILDGAFPSEQAREVVVDKIAGRGGNFTDIRLQFYGAPESTFTYRNDHPGNFRIVVDLDVIVPEVAAAEPSAAKADEQKSTDVKPAEPNAAEKKPDEKKADDGKSGEAKSEQGKSDAAKSTSETPAAAPPTPPAHLVLALQSGVAEKIELISQDFPRESKHYEFSFEQSWTTEPHKFDFSTVALPSPPGGRRRGGGGAPPGRGNEGPRFLVNAVRIKPVRTELAKRYFPLDAPPADAAELRAYLKNGIAEFGLHAYRRPVDPRTIDTLVAEVEKSFQETSRFNDSLKPALAKLLCSPRFLFRLDRPVAEKTEKPSALVDEYSLASRLSYFLWSSMPDDELLNLARDGKLRENLQAQVTRMLASEKSRNFIDNFSGQWLQTRNVLNWSIVEPAVLDREGIKSTKPVLTPAVRQAMVDETTMFFSRIVRENRSVLEFIESDYTYLNEPLAKHYGIPNVAGPEMRLVELTKDMHRGGALTQGTMLLVTSNPNRTSPVKRGVFVLDKFLGLRPHDPPPNIPGLEDAAAGIKDREPTFREMLELHRADVLCASCHQLMDPIGLALENFNAMGGYREQEFKQPIDASGTLITGESFKGIDDLKQVLLTKHRENFYRNLTEKLLTYGLGREIGYHDTETVDRIVGKLEAEGGKFNALLAGIIDSAPFQKRRVIATASGGRE